MPVLHSVHMNPFAPVLKLIPGALLPEHIYPSDCDIALPI